MKRSPDRLYELLPVIHRMRDAEQGYALRALLRVVSEQVGVVESDVEQLYRNWFIETCEDWVVPYLGELVGYRPVQDPGRVGNGTFEDGGRNRILIPRREIANTIAFRRRKGALALLEELAFSVAGWPARAVEFYSLLGWTQHLNHPRLKRGGTIDLRNRELLGHLHGPFDLAAHTVDLRSINSQRSHGRYNINNVGLFVWRLKSYSVTHAPAACIEDQGAHCYTFSVLGNDTPFYNNPTPEAEATHIAGEVNLPLPIRRRIFEAPLAENEIATGKSAHASETYYGEGKSVAVWANDWPKSDQPDSDKALQPIPIDRIIPADLSGWTYSAPTDHVLVDPKLGRMIFPERQLPEKGVYVSYYYGFSADMGGGEYDRTTPETSLSAISRFHRLDFRKPKQLLAKLKKSSPASDFIRARLSEVTAGRLTLFQPQIEASAELLDGLVADLTRILSDGGLYDHLRSTIEGDHILKTDAQLQQLIGLWNQNPRPVDLVVRLNRVLLEAQYPDDIAKSFVHYSVSAAGTGKPNDVEPFNQVLDRWAREKPRHAVIEFIDSDAYLGRVNLILETGQTLHIQARNGTRPVIRLLDWNLNRSDAFKVRGGEGSRLVLDGLLITGRGLAVSGPSHAMEQRRSVDQGDLCEVVIRHTTLVPGWGLECDCASKNPSEPSLELINTHANIKIERSIIGSIFVIADEVHSEPVKILIADSIVDATSPHLVAIGTAAAHIAHANLTVVRSTVIGDVHSHTISLAENSIFIGLVTVARRQVGCCRFSYIRPESRSPRRYECQPDLVEKAVREQVLENKLPASQQDAAIALEQHRVAPQFNSVRYGIPTYCQLAESCAVEISEGADDESEIGAFHHLYQPQRLANLRARLDEYTPAGMDTGIINAS